MKHYTHVLSIAGHETLCSAGMGADLKSFAANGCYGLGALTSIVNDNPKDIISIKHLPEAFVVSQIKTLLDSMPIKAAKTGMLNSASLIKEVTSILSQYPDLTLVVDPVIMASGGYQMINDEAVLAYKEGLLSMATIITPNFLEAQHLSGRTIHSLEELHDCAQFLAETYQTSVVIKSGCFDSKKIHDVLYDLPNKKLHTFTYDKVDTHNVNGSGCSFSATITANLGKGESLYDAVYHAKEYLDAAIRSGAEFSFGVGYGPINHFVNGAPTPTIDQ